MFQIRAIELNERNLEYLLKSFTNPRDEAKFVYALLHTSPWGQTYYLLREMNGVLFTQDYLGKIVSGSLLEANYNFDPPPPTATWFEIHRKEANVDAGSNGASGQSRKRTWKR